MHGYYGDVYWYMVAKEKYTGAWLLWRRILVHGFYGEVYWRMVAMEMYTGTWLLWRCILLHCCYGDVDWCMVAMKTNDGMTKDKIWGRMLVGLLWRHMLARGLLW